jgi:hypothetical protein
VTLHISARLVGLRETAEEVLSDLFVPLGLGDPASSELVGFQCVPTLLNNTEVSERPAETGPKPLIPLRNKVAVLNLLLG